MFMGEFRHQLDAKGRMIIPSKFREALNEQFIIPEVWISVCSATHWKNGQRSKKMKNLPLTKEDARKFMRLFFSGAAAVEVDKRGKDQHPV